MNIEKKQNKGRVLDPPTTLHRIVVLGGGESGTGAAVLAAKQGFDVFLSDAASLQPEYRERLDRRHIAYEENGHTDALILNAAEIIKSPGIPETAGIVRKVREAKIPVISEIEFAGRYTTSQMICITGSNGKTTTTMLLYHILTAAGRDVGLAGNVGASLALQVAEDPHACYVVELSSFQLDDMFDFRAHIAILLNITPDHLDRYDHCMKNYVDAKLRILRNQTEHDALIYWNDDPLIAPEIERLPPAAVRYPFARRAAPGVRAFCEHANYTLNTPNGTFIMEEDYLALTGIHNLHNSLAAGLAAKLLDIKDDILRQSLCNFRGVEHRLEKVARVRNVEYINDSKATNINSTWYALQSIKTPTVLILGGIDKGNDYSALEPLVYEKCRALIFLGTDNAKLHDCFDGKVLHICDARSMPEAVRLAYELAHKGDTVLLSPACASFDLFKNYEDRGRQFKHYVCHL
jgi:UDP-N-acetylmuramoylalanine--D-glutamate ligase